MIIPWQFSAVFKILTVSRNKSKVSSSSFSHIFKIETFLKLSSPLRGFFSSSNWPEIGWKIVYEEKLC